MCFRSVFLKIFTSLMMTLVFTGVSFTVLAVEVDLNQKVKGIWFSENDSVSDRFNKNAQWIWTDEQLADEVVLARRTFHLNEKPTNGRIKITASDQYRLYINGEFVSVGPARSAAHHQSYDIFDIAGLLKKGDNLIAIKANFEGGRFAYQYTGRAGILVDLSIETEQKNFKLVSDDQWKLASDQSWDKDSKAISRFQLFTNDAINFNKAIKGWNTQSYIEDENWKPAIPLMRNVGWPAPQKNAKAQALTPPWTQLVPRDIPYLNQEVVWAKTLFQSSVSALSEVDKEIVLSGEKSKQVIENRNAWTIKTVGKENAVTLFFDFGEIINGFPILEIQGEKNTKVEIKCAPFQVDNQFSHKRVDSEYLDRIMLSGEVDQWEAINFKPTRFLAITVFNSTKEVNITKMGIRQLKYPFEMKGELSSTDWPWIESYFKASAKTIHVCTTDALTDNYRERRQYAQTGYYGALGNYYTFGDYAIQRRYLIQVAQEQKANGIMPAYAPLASDDFMVILDSNCLWIRSLRNYFLYSGDKKTVEALLPAANQLMDLLHGYTNQFGMIDNPPFAYWLDHALNDRRGANLNLNGHYLGALEDFSQILDWMESPETEIYKEKAGFLRVNIREKLWDAERGLFTDALIGEHRSNKFSEHANAMALAMDIATDEQAKRIASELLKEDNHNYIFRESGIPMVTPAMSYFLHKGLCEYGYVDESFKLFNKRFGKMLAPNTNQTLWEEWWLDGIGRTGKFVKGRTRSDAQTESAFPPALFAEYLLGFEPLKPGLEEVIIRNENTTIQNIKAQIPSKYGVLKIDKNVDKNSGVLNIDVPEGIKVKLDWKSFVSVSKRKIRINKKVLEPSKTSNVYIDLKKGSHLITF